MPSGGLCEGRWWWWEGTFGQVRDGLENFSKISICFGLISSALVGAFCGSNDINNENQVQLSDSVGFFFLCGGQYFFWTEYYRAVKWLIHWFTRWTALISTYLFIPHVSNVSTDLVFCPTRKAFFWSELLTTALVGKEGPCEKSLGTITEIATRRQEKTRQYPYISSRGQCVTGRLSWEKETFTDLKLLAALF